MGWPQKDRPTICFTDLFEKKDMIMGKKSVTVKSTLLLSVLLLIAGCSRAPADSHILQAIGDTPLFKIDGVYAKAEMFNPSGSIKDRMAYHVIQKAEERGDLKPGQEIVELTSGNTGVALAMVSAIKGYKLTVVLPEYSSADKMRMIRIYGANLVTTPAGEGFLGAKKKYDQLCLEKPGAWLPKQFENTDNIEAHRLGTGQEIIRQMNGRVDAFVAGVGTGGTLIGVAKALKKADPKVRIFAVEPSESPVMSGKKPGRHRIEGIGDDFIPKIIADNRDLIDEIILIGSDDAIKAAEELAEKHGILVGISSGANLLAAKQIKMKYKYGKVVTILPDGGERYLNSFAKEKR